MQELKRNELVANSKRGATYSLRLMSLREGFAIETRRGAGGKIAGKEVYWRPTEIEAITLYDSIVRRKMSMARKRVYRESHVRLLNRYHFLILSVAEK
jgi:hypothetical protein